MSTPIRILQTNPIRILSGYEDPNLADPQVMLRVSRDGGLSFQTERWESMGKIGQTRHRVMFRRLGSGRDPVFELSGTDPVKVALVGAFLDLDKGIS